MAGIPSASRRVRRGFLLIIAVLSFTHLAPSLRADVTGEGDVSPLGPTALPIDGGVVMGDVTVGGAGTLDIPPIGILTIDVPSFTLPLTSVNGFVGRTIESIGEVTVSGFLSEWRVTNQLNIGYEGEGTIDVTGGARVTTNYLITTSPQNPPELDGYDLWLGRYEGAQGFATVAGIASLLQSGNMSIGHRGFGRIDVTAGGRLVTRSRASIGTTFQASDNALGDGYVLIDGQGSRWTIGLTKTSAPGSVEPDSLEGRLFVGREGHGTLEIRNRGLVRVEEDAFLGGGTGTSGDLTRAYGKVYVSGANSQLQMLRDLYVGDDAGITAGLLDVGTGAVVRADGISSPGPFGTRVGPKGFINMTGGSILTPNLTNNGVLRGAGTVDVAVLLTNNGDIRNAATLANERERLLFTGPVTNSAGAIIESIGGEMEFQESVINDGLIYGKDAIFRFKGDLLPLAGGGDMTLDNTVVESLVAALPVAQLTLAPSKSQILGSIALGGLDVTLGNTFSQLAVTGDATIGGVLDISLKSGFAPQLGATFEILSAASRTGVFSAIVGAAGPGGFWNVAYTPTSVFLNFASMPGPVFASDFNGDGMVNSGDLTIWKMNFGKMPATLADGDANGDGKVDGADFLLWQQQNGSMFPAVAAAGSVPEPSTLALGLLALLPLGRRLSTRRGPCDTGGHEHAIK